MIQLQSLEALDQHQQFLQKRMKNPNLFLVGGCIRDLLLWITQNPLDIDFTMGGKPEELYENFDKEGLSHFITEKFGTATFIAPTTPLLKGGRPDLGMPDSATTGGSKVTKSEVTYELTPLRTEGNYEDFRHPWEIQRSNSLILDSQRRDFTINAMYYFSISKQTKAELDFTKEGHEIDDKKLIKILNSEGYCYITNLNLLILRDESFINQIFAEAKFDEDYFRYLIEIQKEGYLRPSVGTFRKNVRKQSNKQKIPPAPLHERGLFRVLIDPTGWLTSLVNRKLETVGEADKRFGEDALRLIRALRIVNVCNTKGGPEGLFDFTTDTRESIKRNAHLIQHVAKERIKDEICKIFTKGDPFWFIVLLNVSGMMPILFPELTKTKFNEQPIRYHAFDTYSHTLLGLKALQEINADYLVRFAMLYHDVGKVVQYEAYEQAKDREEIRTIVAGPLNHRNSSAELMKQDFRALGFSNKEMETIARYIEHHHTPGEILNANPENREKKVRKLLSEKWFEMVDNLFDINIADRIGQYNPLQNSGDLRDSYELKNILKKLDQEEGQFKKSDLAVDGTTLMKELQLEAWPLLGELLQQTFDRVINDIPARNSEKEILVYLRSYLKNRKEDR